LCYCVSVFRHHRRPATTLPAFAALSPPTAHYHCQRRAAINDAIAFVFIVFVVAVSFFILEKQLSSQNIFLVKSKLSITTYLFLVF
jgi:hypothetical protein